MTSDGRSGPSTITYAVENPASEAALWCLAQYFRELDARFANGFDPAASLPAEVDDLTPPNGALVLARRDGEPVGCGALKFHDAWAELKRMWIAPGARGLGVGRRLLIELERTAARNRIALIRLETNRSLVEAVSLYRKSGYREVAAFNSEPYADHWFEKRLPGPDAPGFGSA